MTRIPHHARDPRGCGTCLGGSRLRAALDERAVHGEVLGPGRDQGRPRHRESPRPATASPICSAPARSAGIGKGDATAPSRASRSPGPGSMIVGSKGKLLFKVARPAPGLRRRGWPRLQRLSLAARAGKVTGGQRQVRQGSRHAQVHGHLRPRPGDVLSQVHREPDRLADVRSKERPHETDSDLPPCSPPAPSSQPVRPRRPTRSRRRSRRPSRRRLHRGLRTG